HVRPAGRELLAHVHDLHAGERTIEDAAREDHAIVPARPRVLRRLERWRRSPEYDERLLEPSAHDGDVASVIPRRFFLLVRRVVFLIDNDEPDVLERREHGRARADHDADLAAPDAMPLVVPLTRRKPAVLDRHGVAESRP